MSARAIAMRWRWPPLNSCGTLSRSAAAQAHRVEQASIARSRCSAAADVVDLPAARRPSAGDVMRGSSEPKGPGRPSGTRAARGAVRRRQPVQVAAFEQHAAVVGLPGPSPVAPACSCPSPIHRRAQRGARVQRETHVVEGVDERTRRQQGFAWQAVIAGPGRWLRPAAPSFGCLPANAAHAVARTDGLRRRQRDAARVDANAQRSANTQPAGISCSAGTRPAMVASGTRRSVPRRGRAANRPRV